MQLITKADLHRSSLLSDQHSILLRWGESWPLHHDRD